MLIRSALMLLLTLAALPAWSVELAMTDCPALPLSPEVARYELQGSAKLEIRRAANGVPATVRLASGSGWKLLDEDALALAKTCRFAQPPHGKPQETDTLTVTWPPATIPAGAVAAQLLTGSCRQTPLFRSGPAASAADTLRLRLLVWNDGQVFAPKLETSSGDELVDSLAIAYVQSCRYSPAVRDGKPARSGAVLEVALMRSAYDEAALSAVYERVLPLIQARAAARPEFKVAHILVASEARAREVHAAIVKGAAFGEQARAWSIDRGGKDGGELGWSDAKVYDEVFASTLLAAKGEGLLPDVIKTQYGWHVIRIDGVRPGRVPSFVQLRTIIRGWVLRDEVAQFEERIRKF